MVDTRTTVRDVYANGWTIERDENDGFIAGGIRVKRGHNNSYYINIYGREYVGSKMAVFQDIAFYESDDETLATTSALINLIEHNSRRDMASLILPLGISDLIIYLEWQTDMYGDYYQLNIESMNGDILVNWVSDKLNFTDALHGLPSTGGHIDGVQTITLLALDAYTKFVQLCNNY